MCIVHTATAAEELTTKNNEQASNNWLRDHDENGHPLSYQRRNNHQDGTYHHNSTTSHLHRTHSNTSSWLSCNAQLLYAKMYTL